MKYYVVSDIHGFYEPLTRALKANGFFEDKEPHKLIVCGDMLDRGGEARKVQDFMMELLYKDELIFIRGNHEDLMVDMLDNLYEDYNYICCGMSHHVRNGTFDTALQLAQTGITDPGKFVYKVKSSDFYKTLLPASLDYYETDNYIFVHGWIPCIKDKGTYAYNPDWRTAHTSSWQKARWLNGMYISEDRKVFEPDKIIVCGHWHTSFGHCKFEHKGSEFGEDADFSPFYSENIIALDACTAYSGVTNCVVIND